MDRMYDERLLTIIIPVCGRTENLAGTVSSIATQSYRNIEILLVDDKTSDATQTLLKNTQNVRFLSSSPFPCSRFHAILAGMKEAKGQWVAFADPGDIPGADCFRSLLRDATLADADLVQAEMVQKSQIDGEDLIYPFSRMTDCQDVLEKDHILSFVLSSRGRDPLCHLSRGKLYRRDLLLRAYPHLEKFADKAVCEYEDIVFSVVFSALAVKMFFSSGNPYFFSVVPYIPDVGVSLESFRQQRMASLAHVFDTTESFLEACGLSEYRGPLEKWRTLSVSLLQHEPPFQHFPAALSAEALADFPDSSFSDELKSFFFLRQTRIGGSPELEKIKQQIVSDAVGIVSFDVFDTLVVRPFYEPTDLFVLLGNDFTARYEINTFFDFKELRMRAERIARTTLVDGQGRGEITLRDIYEVFRSMCAWTNEQIDWCMNHECELELQYCFRRKTAWNLYDLARSSGKRVVFTSDMYLPEDTVRRILDKAGYASWDGGYLSSSSGKTKFSGELFSLLSAHEACAPHKILHIGDNYHSDVLTPRRYSLQSAWLPRPIDVLKGATGQYSCFGNIFSFSSMYADGFQALDHLGLRAMLALALNKLFDNPYRRIPLESDFGADPVFLGRFPLGMHLLAFTEWIQKKVKENGLSGLHFMARDGYLPMRAYSLLYGAAPDSVPFDEWHINRKVVSLLQIEKKADFVAWLSSSSSLGVFSPDFFLAVFRFAQPKETMDLARSFFSRNYAMDAPLNEEDRIDFVRTFADDFFDESAAREYRNAMRRYFSAHLFGGNDASVDMGYGCRCEYILGQCGVPLIPLYLHTNNDVAFQRARKGKFPVHCFYDYKPAVSGMLREILFSSTSPSVVGYDFSSGEEPTPVYDDRFDFNYGAQVVTDKIQNAALSFLADWKEIFGSLGEEMYYRRLDASMPLEFFLHSSTAFDHKIFSPLIFDDANGIGMISVSAYWDEVCNTVMSAEKGKAYDHFSLSRQQEQVSRLEAELAAVRQSISYRTFRLVTWPVRMLRKTLRSLLSDGVAETGRRILRKICSLPVLISKK